MFGSLSAVAIATALSVSPVTPGLGASSGDAPAVALAAISSDSVAPNSFQLVVGEYFEGDIDVYDGDRRPSTYSVAPHSRLPKGLQLDARSGVVAGVPEEQTVQLTTFYAVDDETGDRREVYVFFLVANPVIGAPVPTSPASHVPE